MGCCVCKIQFEGLGMQLSYQQKPIILAQKDHPFSSLSANSLYKELFINDSNGTISKRNFSRACNHLHIDPQTENYSLFYENTRCDFQNFFTQKLILLSILLGQGSVQQKASLWFEFYDRQARGKLESCILEMMLDKLVQISACISPLLASERLGTRTVRIYSTKLLKMKKHFTKRLLDLLVGENPELLLEDFQVKMNSISALQQIMFTSGVRYLLIQQSHSPYRILGKHRNKQSLLMNEAQSEYWKIKTPVFCSEISSDSESWNNHRGNNGSAFSDPDSPLEVQVLIKGKIQQFLIYPSENPETIAEAFCETKNLSGKKKQYLISQLEKAKII